MKELFEPENREKLIMSSCEINVLEKARELAKKHSLDIRSLDDDLKEMVLKPILEGIAKSLNNDIEDLHCSVSFRKSFNMDVDLFNAMFYILTPSEKIDNLVLDYHLHKNGDDLFKIKGLIVNRVEKEWLKKALYLKYEQDVKEISLFLQKARSFFEIRDFGESILQSQIQQNLSKFVNILNYLGIIEYVAKEEYEQHWILSTKNKE